MEVRKVVLCCEWGHGVVVLVIPMPVRNSSGTFSGLGGDTVCFIVVDLKAIFARHKIVGHASLRERLDLPQLLSFCSICTYIDRIPRQISCDT